MVWEPGRVKQELLDFIEELIEEISHLSYVVDSEYATNFEAADFERKAMIQRYRDRLNELVTL